MPEFAREILGERFTLYPKVYSGATHIPWHVHRAPHIVFVVAGRIVDQSGCGTEVLEPHTAVFRPPEYRHANELLSELTRVLVAIPQPPFDDRFRSLFEDGIPLSLPFTTFGGTVVRLLEECAIADAFTPMIADALLTEVVILASRVQIHATRSTPPWITSVVAFVETHLGERMKLTDVARFAGLSSTQFSAGFRAHFRVSFGEYLRQRRLAHAVTALLSTDEPLVDVADRLGFVDQAHLTRLFRQTHGLTPARFRQRFRRLQSVPAGSNGR